MKPKDRNIKKVPKKIKVSKKLNKYLEKSDKDFVKFYNRQIDKAEQLQSKVEKLQKASIFVDEVDFVNILMNQCRPKQFDKLNYLDLKSKFEQHDYDSYLIIPIIFIYEDSNKYELITGYHRIEIFKFEYEMIKAWCIVFKIPKSVEEFTKEEKRDIGNLANPILVDNGKPFDESCIAHAVVEKIKDDEMVIPNNKKDLKRLIRTVTNTKVNEYNTKFGAFGKVSPMFITSFKRNVEIMSLLSFHYKQEFRVFNPEEVNDMVLKVRQNKDGIILSPLLSGKNRMNNFRTVMKENLVKPTNTKIKIVLDTDIEGNFSDYEKFIDDCINSVFYEVLTVSESFYHTEYNLYNYDYNINDFIHIVNYYRNKVSISHISPMELKYSDDKLILVSKISKFRKTILNDDEWMKRIRKKWNEKVGVV